MHTDNPLAVNDEVAWTSSSQRGRIWSWREREGFVVEIDHTAGTATVRTRRGNKLWPVMIVQLRRIGAPSPLDAVVDLLREAR